MGGRHYYLARELAKRGFIVYVIGSATHHLMRMKPLFEGRYLIEDLDGCKFVWLKLPQYKNAHSKQRVINWLIFAWWVSKLDNLLEVTPDAILCSSPSPFSFIGAKWLVKKCQARLVFEVRDIWPLTLVEIGKMSPRHPLIKLMQWVEDKAYDEADAVVSNLEKSVEHMVGRGLNRDKFNWVPNGFSLEEVQQQVALSEVTRNRLPQGKFIIGYTGTFGVANALNTLLDAAILLKEHSEIAFVLVGGGMEEHSLKTKAKKAGLNSVVFIDSIPKIEIQGILKEFDACYIGWRNESIYRYGIAANKIFDYLYAGVPVIHSYSGACDPIIRADAGLRIDSENPEGLAEAVLALYRMPASERAVMGRNGRRAALENYEYGSLSEDIAEILSGS